MREDQLVRLGTPIEGPFLAPRTAAQEFDITTRVAAIDQGLPQDRYLQAERIRQVPLVGGFIANRLHKAMLAKLHARRTEDQSARF